MRFRWRPRIAPPKLHAMLRMSLAALAFVAFALPAAAQDRPLTDDEVMDLVRREAVWCENWSEATRDCESLSMLRQGADGGLVQIGMFALTETPAVQAVVADRVTLANGRLCSSGSVDELSIRATIDGQPSAAASLMFQEILARAMAEFADAEICQQLMATDDPDRLAEIITADEDRLPDFESSYRLGTVESGFLLRPILGDDDGGQVQL